MLLSRCHSCSNTIFCFSLTLYPLVHGGPCGLAQSEFITRLRILGGELCFPHQAECHRSRDNQSSCERAVGWCLGGWVGPDLAFPRAASSPQHPNATISLPKLFKGGRLLMQVCLGGWRSDARDMPSLHTSVSVWVHVWVHVGGAV